jgi:ABC-type multidrug transport system ATPase subunit
VNDVLISPVSPIVAIENLIKQFGRFAALRGITAEFAAGRLYAILGDNGAGKTTLLRTLAGLSRPTRGSVSLFGSKEVRAVCGQIGYMAHPSLLYDEMSGMENLRYFARLYGIEDGGIEDERRCADAIRAVKLDPALARPVGQYSQGMRQRMSLARALLNDPKILLLDEPFSNVDIHSAHEMVVLLVEMRNAGKTVFVVTHQAALLEKAADEFVWMEAGQIVQREQKSAVGT